MAWTICLSDADISTLTTAYTVAVGNEARLTASFCNRSTSATATVQLWVVPSGETRGNEHLKEAGTTLGLAGTPQAVLERSFVAPAGCVVYVQASTANVSCQVQGDVVTPASFTVTDGTSSISYGSNWSADEVLLKKDQNGQVHLNMSVIASSSSVGVYPITLPSGYRPAADIVGAAGTHSYSGTIYAAWFSIDTAGRLSWITAPSNLGISATTNSVITVHLSFWS